VFGNSIFNTLRDPVVDQLATSHTRNHVTAFGQSLQRNPRTKLLNGAPALTSRV
jgi:hypothetical protein